MIEAVHAVQRILARLAVDTRNGRAVLRSEPGTAAQSTDFASGPAGLALSFLELGRATQEEQWLSIARDAVGHAALAQPTGSGMFSGPEGLEAVRFAVFGRPEHERHVLDSGEMVHGDLMNGAVGVRWASMCVGLGPGTATSTARTRNYESFTGLAHGYLGVEATSSVQAAIPERLRMIRAHKPPLNNDGWCNGTAGYLAALGGLGFDREAFDEVTDIALQLVGASPMVTDSLCHGTAGRVAVLAGMARLLGNDDLLKEVQKGATMLALRASRGGVRLNDGFILDHSWLTGSSGVCWGVLAAFKRPTINPLVPSDSIFANIDRLPGHVAPTLS